MLHDPVKCLTVIPGDGEGSSMIFAKNQVDDIRNLGIRNQIFFLKNRTRFFSVIKEIRNLKDVIREYNPDVMHCHYGTVTSFICALISPKPLVITFHGSDLNMSPGLSFFRNYFGYLFSQLSVLGASKIICVNSKMKQKLWWKQTSTVVYPMGIDPELFIPMDRTESKKKLGLDPIKKYIFFNGNNPSVKRTDIARAVERIVQKSIHDAELLLLTGGIDPKMIPVYLNASDCVLLCSDSEGSPMVIKEAIACNVPIVSSDVGDVKEQIENIENCFVVERDPLIIANKIYQIILSGKRSNGRDFIAKISSKNIASKIVDLYKEIIKH